MAKLPVFRPCSETEKAPKLSHVRFNKQATMHKFECVLLICIYFSSIDELRFTQGTQKKTIPADRSGTVLAIMILIA